jgi:hypothetical protein
MTPRTLRFRIATAALAVFGITLTVSPETARASGRGGSSVAFGLTADQRLIRFRIRDPRAAKEIGPITGLSGDTRLVGIDFRPANGVLYGIGEAGGVYTLDLATGEATFRSQLAVGGVPRGLTGASFGVDFNPAADRLRVVADGGENLRIDVETGAGTVDGALNLPTTPPTPATGVTGAAYTNNDGDPDTATTLFDLDATLDQVVIQSPPNAGTLAATGKLGVDVAPDLGFDVLTRRKHGETSDQLAFLAATTDRTRLYEVDLLTGDATPRGAFRSEDVLIGLALRP